MQEDIINAQNAAEEENTMLYLAEMARLEVQTNPIRATVRSGQFEIKVTGDPFATFAKGPRDLP